MDDAIVEPVRVEIYRSFVEDGRAPTVDGIVARIDRSVEEVERALLALDAGDVIALDPSTGALWLAHPFCATPAPFKVRSGPRAWDAICVWDALGILAVIDEDGTVETHCPDCGEAIELRVVDGRIDDAEGVVHYGVPASRWYEDIGYT